MLASAEDLLITDFEVRQFDQKHDDVRVFEGWEFQGDAFGRGPYEAQQRVSQVSNYKGRYFISSAVHDDARTGRIRTPSFTLSQPFLRLLISGGQHPGKTCVNLLIEDTVVRSATGHDDDHLRPVAFDVSEFQGQEARLEILDDHRGLWGHISVDHILLAADSAKAEVISKRPQEPETFWQVLTTEGAHRGPLSLADSAIQAGDAALSVADLVYALAPPRLPTDSKRDTLVLANGERWNGEILGLDKEELRIRSQLFQERKLPISAVASLHFGGVEPGLTTSPNTLYRRNGEPIPGKLVWIQDDSVAIDCVLGVVPVPRQEVLRFGLNPPQPPGTTGDQVTLTDGSILRGTLEVVEAQWRLKHDILGDLKLDPDSIQHLLRSSQRVRWLDALDYEVVERAGPLSRAPMPRALPTARGFLRGLRLWPDTRLRVDLPAAATLRTTIAAMPTAESATRLLIRAGDALLWEGAISADNPTALELAVPQGVLEFEARFGERLSFPCALDLRDACVVTAE